MIKYNRQDGLELSATLYLPEGYDFNNKKKLPLLMWAYPREYKDKSSASQTTKNPNQLLIYMQDLQFIGLLGDMPF